MGHIFNMGRDRRQKFVELAEKRTNKAIDYIRLVGNLANKNNYQYTDADAKAILRALDDELKALRVKFEQSNKGEKAFKL